MLHVQIGASPEKIVDFVNDLSATGGGDAPEATKTGLNRIADMIRESERDFQQHQRRKSLVIHYTDAPPHCEESDSERSNKSRRKHSCKEKNRDTIGFTFAGFSPYATSPFTHL